MNIPFPFLPGKNEEIAGKFYWINVFSSSLPMRSSEKLRRLLSVFAPTSPNNNRMAGFFSGVEIEKTWGSQSYQPIEIIMLLFHSLNQLAPRQSVNNAASAAKNNALAELFTRAKQKPQAALEFGCLEILESILSDKGTSTQRRGGLTTYK